MADLALGRTLVIAITNNKGGVGKTTSAAHLAGVFSCLLGLRTLVIDADSQGNLSSFLRPREEIDLTLLDVLDEDPDRAAPVDEVILPTRIPTLDLLPARPVLAKLNTLIVSMTMRELVIRNKVVAPLVEQGRYDVILFDLPPSLDHVPVACLAASTHVLIPVQAHPLSLSGLRDSLAWHDNRTRAGVTSAELAGLLLTQVDLRTNACREVVGSVRRNRPDDTMQTLVRISTMFNEITEAPEGKRPLAGEPDADAYDPKVTDFYLAAGAELLARVGHPFELPKRLLARVEREQPDVLPVLA